MEQSIDPISLQIQDQPLIRASEFCQWSTDSSRAVPVRCHAILSYEQDEEDEDDARNQPGHDPEGRGGGGAFVVYATSIELLQKLGTPAGSRVSISTTAASAASLGPDCNTRQIVATILLQQQRRRRDDRLLCTEEQPQEPHILAWEDASLLLLPRVHLSFWAAAHLGWWPPTTNTREASTTTLVSHSDVRVASVDIVAVFTTKLPVAVECRLAMVGRPLTASSPGTEPSIPPLPLARTWLQPGILVPVSRVNPSSPGNNHSETYHYFVLQVTTSEGDDAPSGYLSTLHTKYTIETFRGNMVPRLPSLSECRSDDEIPHPDAERLVQLWQSYHAPVHDTTLAIPHIQPAECIWHLVGTDHDHHVTRAIQCAAARVGRQCLVTTGLAATAYRAAAANNSHVAVTGVTTGGIVDKLAGLQYALDEALDHAPSVLVLSNMCHEVSLHDVGVRHQEESRIWSLLVEGLAHHMNGPTAWSHLTKGPQTWPWWGPPVLVVIQTHHAFIGAPPTAWRQNLIYASIQASLPNEAYIEFLWQCRDNVTDDTASKSFSLDDIPVNVLLKLMKGRPAGKILEIRDEWNRERRRTNSTDGSILLERICRDHDQARRHVAGGSRIPSTKWEDIGGLAHVRREILDAIELPLQYPHMFSSTGGGRSGMLLFGPPGSGKTLVAKAVATECGLPFLSIKGPELLGSYVGQSEAQVRATFQQARELARQNQPAASILFFDELDSLAPRRGDQAMGGNVMDRVVATLLSELDQYHDDIFVFCMGATNRPDLLDPALLRPGRLDRLVYLGISPGDYATILATQLRKLRLTGDADEMAATLVAHHLPPNLTGADLSTIASGGLLCATERLCREADRELEQLRSERLGLGQNADVLTIDDVLLSWDEAKLEPVVTMEDLLAASRTIVPSVSAAELENYERMGRQFTTTT